MRPLFRSQRAALRRSRLLAPAEFLESRKLLTGQPILIDLNPEGSAMPEGFTQVDDVAFFVAQDPQAGNELWRTDGTPEGTFLVADLALGASSSSPRNLAEFDGQLFFAADDGVTGEELWMSDGTLAGTVLVRDIHPGFGYQYPRGDGILQSFPRGFVEFDGQLLFRAEDEASGGELWATDGTAAGTALVVDMFPGETTGYAPTPYPNSSNPSGMVEVDGKLFFSAENELGRELWVSTGSSDGTVVVSDIFPGTYTSNLGPEPETLPNSSYPSRLTAAAGLVFFVATDDDHGAELWVSDGTGEGTRLVRDIDPGPGNGIADSGELVAVGDRVLFSARDGQNGTELWISDGTESGTQMVADIHPNGSGLEDVHFAVVDDTVYFAADDGQRGVELWRSDGTEQGTQLVADSVVGQTGSYPEELTVVDGTLLFTAEDESGRELWESNGTGTERVADLAAGPAGSHPTDLTSLGDRLLFAATVDGDTELWTVDVNAETEPFEVRLTIFVDGQQVSVPASVGVDAEGNGLSLVRSVDEAGTIEVGPLEGSPQPEVTLGDFFETWRTNAGVAGNNADAQFDGTQLLDNSADVTRGVQMFVNGNVSQEFDQYELQPGDEVILVYGANPVVSLNTSFGPIVIELFEQEAPGTVANFLNYVNDGDYLGTFFHRSADSMGEDFVIQGGGFSTTSAVFESVDQFRPIETDPPIQNEPGRSNVRGTVAMAKSSDPDSATSQFFVNLRDTNSFLDDPSRSGGFTVFGQVLDMTSSDQIASLPIDSDNPDPYAELPVAEDGTLVVIESLEGSGSVSGTKFNDANQNGLMDPDEVGVGGATVFVDRNSNGRLDDDELSTQTDAEGRYRLLVSAGSQTIATVNDDGAVLSAPASESFSTVVEIGRDQPNLDFALVAASEDGTDSDPPSNPGSNTISGAVYLDHNADSSRQSDDDGVPGSRITLAGTDDAGNPVTMTALTLDDGSYRFEGVPNGNYSLTQLQSLILVNGDAATETMDATASGNQITDLVVSGGESSINNDFSELAIRAEFVSSVWCFSSSDSPQSLLREVMAIGAERSGDRALAALIRMGATDSPSVNVAPIANDDQYRVQADRILEVSAQEGVLANDTDLDNDPLTANLVTSTTNGSLTLDSDGSFTYEPNVDFIGTDEFTYNVSDGEATSGTATVTIEVDTNAAPTGAPDQYTIAEDATLDVSATDGVLANDTDAENDALTVALAQAPGNGQVSISADGSFQYVPINDFNGTDSFEYQVSDGQLADRVTVTINVTPVNDPPVAVDDALMVDEDTTLQRAANAGVLANDMDVDGDPITAQVTAEPENGQLFLSLDGSFSYTPNADFFGTDRFEYEVRDGESRDTATVTIDVLPVNDPPVGGADTYAAVEDETLQIAASGGLLANDLDAEGNQLTARLLEQASSGNVTVGEDGSFTYVPNQHFAGSDSFIYVASDGVEDSLPALVTINVAEVDDPGVIVLPAEVELNQRQVSASLGDPFGFAILVDDVDDSDYVFQLDLEASGIPAGAALPAIDASSGLFQWTPTVLGTFEIRVIAVNGDREADQATFTVVVDEIESEAG